MGCLVRSFCLTLYCWAQGEEGARMVAFVDPCGIEICVSGEYWRHYSIVAEVSV